jgi:hypothetical protein
MGLVGTKVWSCQESSSVACRIIRPFRFVECAERIVVSFLLVFFSTIKLLFTQKDLQTHPEIASGWFPWSPYVKRC